MLYTVAWKKMKPLSYNRNNLDKSHSPYLLQHAANPVWWQEWDSDLLKRASELNKPLFVSVGYSTCHWCHVMAREAFSDVNTSDFLNKNFICIKVDREQRPDIDQYMMDFLTQQNGSGGWPLNVFLSPSMHPVYALTYAPAQDTPSMYSLLSIAEKVLDFYRENSDKIPAYIIPDKKSVAVGENSIIRILSDYYDPENGGFGNLQKFPPHSTLLYLLYHLSINESLQVRSMCTKTLDAIRHRGLNDHLQGGIYRYCVDPEWTIPHFEKMLYDQAMALWVYSVAYGVIGSDGYKAMADDILRCLEESFESNGLYISAYDADTDHKEGGTYLWNYGELKSILSPQEFSEFTEVYDIRSEGNFEGVIHLIRKNDRNIQEIERKLLEVRKQREQPSRDEKIMCGLNALTATTFINASRIFDRPELEAKAVNIVRKLKDNFWNGKELAHALYKGQLQQQSFLFDAAALFTAVTFLFEEDITWKGFMDELESYLYTFKAGESWIESKTTDFPRVYASWFDHPAPSGVSMAEMGLARYSLLKGSEEYITNEFRQPFQSDFYNIAVMISKGLFHVYTSESKIKWDTLPVNSIQLRGKPEQDCFMGVCRPLSLHGIER
jgi:uncharacterized protein YyaL (SSP411 family)